MLKDTELLAQKPRFGLFSSPVPLGLGDDSMEIKLKRKTINLLNQQKEVKMVNLLQNPPMLKYPLIAQAE